MSYIESINTGNTTINGTESTNERHGSRLRTIRTLPMGKGTTMDAKDGYTMSTREATPAEVEAFEAGKQKLYRCPECAHEREVLDALIVWCGECRHHRQRMVQMVVVEDTSPDG